MSINPQGRVVTLGAPKATFTLRETTEMIVKHLGIHEGKFELLMEFQIGIGQFGPAPDNMFPGASVGVSKIGIAESTNPGPNTVDAALANPAQKAITKKKKT